ncbi:MAG: glucans biosynthesis glucosyltransferase MdoH [Hyphomicrobiaceae bacterium]
MTDFADKPRPEPDAIGRLTLFRDVDAMASMPAPAPLEMPTQSLSAHVRARRYARPANGSDVLVWFIRAIVFGGAVALTIYGANEMYGVVSLGGVTALEWVLLVLFVVSFSWISLALTSAVVGALSVATPWHKPRAPQTLSTQTAVVMPTYNEDPARVFSALAATVDDLIEGPDAALARHFHWFVLSDTTDPDIWMAEERVFIELQHRLAERAQVFYRHRPRNVGRKSGNIADFVTGWGAAYDHMIVLDADSLMSADSVVTLAATMQADPSAGIIQTLPLIINRNTMFARLQQFAARIYGPVIAHGLSAWSGRDGNFWGHNAIIRTRAFAACCGLPRLSGAPPFGGHVLSHDFVEAALMRRGGYAVYMLPRLAGSYEESPPTLVDLAIRDRRWCQGNLQHIRILPARGLKLASRQHLASGIMSYLASPIWMAQLLVGIVLVLQSHYVRPEYFTSEFELLPAWPRFDAERALRLFGVTLAVLLAPKLFGLLLSLTDRATRRASGGAIRMTASSMLEIILSALLAPIMMVVQTGAIMRIVMGRDSGWDPQRRDDGSIPFSQILRRHFSHMLLGFVTLVAGLLISPSLVAWMSPTIAGLLLAAFLSWGSGQLSLGLALRKAKILLTPEETQPPAVVGLARRWQSLLVQAAQPDVDGLRILHGDRELRELHRRFLPPPAERHRGDIDAGRAVANAKLDDALSIEDAVAWLKAPERTAVLLDRALLARLAALPAAPGESDEML